MTAALLLAASLAAAMPAAAALYKWTDRNGITHFSDDPPPDGVRGKRLTSPQRSANGASAVLRKRRCANFRKALEQLNTVDAVAKDNADWLGAKKRATAGIQRWCD